MEKNRGQVWTPPAFFYTPPFHAPMPLVDLPTELLDAIFALLTDFRVPYDPTDALSVHATCRAFRDYELVEDVIKVKKRVKEELGKLGVDHIFGKTVYKSGVVIDHRKRFTDFWSDSFYDLDVIRVIVKLGTGLQNCVVPHMGFEYGSKEWYYERKMKLIDLGFPLDEFRVPVNLFVNAAQYIDERFDDNQGMQACELFDQMCDFIVETYDDVFGVGDHEESDEESQEANKLSSTPGPPPDAATWDDLYDPKVSLQRRELSGLWDWGRAPDVVSLADARVRYRSAWRLCAHICRRFCVEYLEEPFAMMGAARRVT